jgi:hypothetical protein
MCSKYLFIFINLQNKYLSRDTIPFIWLQYFNLRALCEKKLIGLEAVQSVRAYIESFEAVLGTQARNNIFLRNVPLRRLYFPFSLPEIILVKLPCEKVKFLHPNTFKKLCYMFLLLPILSNHTPALTKKANKIFKSHDSAHKMFTFTCLQKIRQSRETFPFSTVFPITTFQPFKYFFTCRIQGGCLSCSTP